MTMYISSAFDSGNIIVEHIDDTNATLTIRKDQDSDFFQWFHFRVDGPAGKKAVLRITGLNEAGFPDGWPGYAARCSIARGEEWYTTEATHWDEKVDGGTLTIEQTLPEGPMWFAYFAPFSWERHQDMVAAFSDIVGVEHRILGFTLDGRTMDCLELGEGKTQIWLYARQHPGESMAEWWMEGALEMLADPADPHTKLLLRHARLHIVPNMNPDGSVRGHLRTNAVGVNLNREWHAPSAERSPEVLCVLDAMDESGLDIAIDVHGDEAIPANFVAGYEGIPSWTDEHGARFYAFRDRLAARSPDFQMKLGYVLTPSGEANLSLSTNQLAERFGAMAMTLEMPFKDNIDLPDPDTGWSPARSKLLARACLKTLAEYLIDN